MEDRAGGKPYEIKLKKTTHPFFPQIKSAASTTPCAKHVSPERKRLVLNGYMFKYFLTGDESYKKKCFSKNSRWRGKKRKFEFDNDSFAGRLGQIPASTPETFKKALHDATCFSKQSQRRGKIEAPNAAAYRQHFGRPRVAPSQVGSRRQPSAAKKTFKKAPRDTRFFSKQSWRRGKMQAPNASADFPGGSRHPRLKKRHLKKPLLAQSFFSKQSQRRGKPRALNAAAYRQHLERRPPSGSIPPSTPARHTRPSERPSAAQHCFQNSVDGGEKGGPYAPPLTGPPSAGRTSPSLGHGPGPGPDARPPKQ